jgi:peptide/nickel transport system permease protein
MIHYLIRRLITAVLMLVALSVVSFAVIELPPGSAAEGKYVAMLDEGPDHYKAVIAEIEKIWGLDGPIHERYFNWVSGIVTKGQFGYSFTRERHVELIIKERLPTTVMIGLVVLFFQYIVAVPMAIISAVKQYSVVDHSMTFFSFLGMSIPNFLLAIILIILFHFQFFPGWPVGGLVSPEYVGVAWDWDKFVDFTKHLVIPVIVIGTAVTATTIRILRATMLDEFGQEYMRVARAKGLPEYRIILKYPLRIAINPILASVGWSLPVIIGGNVIISIVMDLPDLGPILYNALLQQDPYLSGSILFVLSTLTIVGTLISDILLALSDPRIDYTEAK